MIERVEREQLIEADAADVWAAVTADGWLADEVTLELWPSGEAVFRTGDEVRRGWVEEALPNRRLAFWWATDGDPATRVELTLTPEIDGTTVRVVESRPLEVLDLVGLPLPGSGGASHGPALVAA